MLVFTLQSAFLLLAAYLIGCVVGSWIARLFPRPEDEIIIAAPQPTAAQLLQNMQAINRPGSATASAAAKIESQPKASVVPLIKETPAPAATPAVKVVKSEPELVEHKDDDKAHPGKRPSGYKKPLNNKPDDLKVIIGIGPVNEKKLNELGIYHFEQIANWKSSEIKWVGSFLRFPDRIEREAWVSQAKNLIRFK